MRTEVPSETAWLETITPSTNVWSLRLREIWNYRDLLTIWIRRDILSVYQQTILGPLWFLVQPVLTTLVYVIVFSRIGGFTTMDVPPIVFYMSGVVLWSYFSDCILKTSSFLKDSAGVLSKVYFPRLIIPLSIVISNLVKLGIQLLLFLAVYLFFFFTGSGTLSPTPHLLLLPVLVAMIGALGFGTGTLVASLTSKYKDLMHLITFGVQILMFVSPVFFPLAQVKEGIFRTFLLINPMSGIIETFRYAFIGKGVLDWSLLAYDAIFIAGFLVLSVVVFNTIEKDFVDSI